jgi:RES domain-containing protein
MKVGSLGPDAVLYRYLTPKWAFLPLSGAGSAIDGGRFNRVGIEALYLSLAPQTALEEYRQGSSLVPPATLASYVATIGNLVDLSEGYDPARWPAEWANWDCAWRRIVRLEKTTPPSWGLADAVISAGHKGILFPSLRHPGGANVVLYHANFDDQDRLEVHDPDGQLPRDQSSWPA